MGNEQRLRVMVLAALSGLFNLMLLLQLGLPDANLPVLILGGYSDLLYLPVYALFFVCLWLRHLRLALLQLLPLLWHISLISPALAARTPPAACGETLTLLSANLLMVNPDPSILGQEILDANADLLAFQEYSSRWEEELRKNGVRKAYPYGIDIVRDDSFGTAIWSKTPLVDARLFELTELPQSRAQVRIGSGVVDILNIHTLPPRTVAYLAPHKAALDTLYTWMAETPDPYIVTGDFNASAYAPFSRRARKIADNAWELIGHGMGYTWPNGVFPLPPMRLDHVWLARDLTVTAMEIGTGAYSDHRPLRVVLAPRVGGRLCPR